MSFNKMRLPDFLFADLYKDVLVELKTDSPAKKKEPVKAPPLRFLGENKKQVVILVRDEEAVYLRDEWLNFLSAILGACKLNLGDVAIINHAKTAVAFPALAQELQPQFLLLFDVMATEVALAVTAPFYEVSSCHGCRLLMSPSLQSMQGNTTEAKLEKSKLWLGLKIMFGI